jgi:hypothetical protein
MFNANGNARGTEMCDPEVIKRANEQLAAEYRRYSLEELRWDWGCNIRNETRKILIAELNRRGIAFEEFEKLGQGVRRRDDAR